MKRKALTHLMAVASLLLCAIVAHAKEQVELDATGALQPLSESAPEKAQDGKGREQSNLYIGLLSQLAGSASGSASASIAGSCILLSCSTPSSSVQEGGSVTDLSLVGLRMGWWWDNLGVTAELNQQQARIEQLSGNASIPAVSPTYFELNTVNLYLIPMARLPLTEALKGERSRWGLYGGIGVVVFGYSEDFKVASPQLANESHSVSFGVAAASTQGNLMALLGVEYMVSDYMLYVEQRVLQNNISASGLFGVNGSADVRSSVTVAGVSIKYR